MKQQTLWIRVLVLALALVMTVSVFAACSTDDEAAATTEPAGTEKPINTDEDGFVVDNLGDDLNFETTVKILGEEKFATQFWVKEEDVGDHPVRLELYKRNETVQERLGIEIKWTLAKGDWNNKDNFLHVVETACETSPYDAMCCYNLVPYMLAAKGLCANLYDTPYMDLTAPWWPESLLSEILVNDTLYAVTESNDYGLLKNMMAMFFHVEMLEAKGMEDPYTLVANNEWTIDKLASMIKESYEDKNGDGKFDTGDIYGYINATTAKRDAWYFALGYKYAEVEDNEIISLLGGTQIQDYIDKMVDFYSTDDTMLADEAKYGGSEQNYMFLNEKACFYSAGVYITGEIKEKELTFEYGVVPMPKLNSEQERYYTHLSNTYDAWCVSHNAKSLDVSSAILECMASEAYRHIGPTYFETYVKLRYASNEKLAPMYDLVRDSVTFDLIYLYSCAFSGDEPKEIVKSCITNPTANSWSSKYATYKDGWNSSFASIVATYNK